jgi:hypothetical protein
VTGVVGSVMLLLQLAPYVTIAQFADEHVGAIENGTSRFGCNR